MDTGFSGDEQLQQSNVAIKHEPVEETMTGSGDRPMDMSVVPRDNYPEPSHCYMPATMSHDMSRGSYLSALYANKHIMHGQDALSQQHFLNQRHPHYPEPQHAQPQHPLVSPPSQHQPQEHLHQKLQTSPNQGRSAVQVSPISPSAHLPPKVDGVPSFKLKDSSGKLAMLDMLSEEGSSSSMDFLSLTGHQRAKREFVPDNKKDECYWNKRLKNNDSARRSRVKRKALEKMMESRLMELQKENIELRHEMAALKRRFGIVEESPPILPPIPTETNSSVSHEMSSDRSSSFSRDEELEQQSAGSDDSHSHDDSRAYNLGSMSLLSHSLGPSMRDRADSFGSGTSSGGRSSRPDSRSSQPGHSEHLVRTDKSGALDLSSDNSNRSTPARDSITPENFEQKGRGRSESEMEGEEKKDGQDLRAFPLKCRWKREMQSVANTAALSATLTTNSAEQKMHHFPSSSSP